MKSYLFRLLQLLEDDQGQGTVEYVLVLSLSMTAGIGLCKLLLSALDGGVMNLGSQLEMDLRSGKVALNVWKN